MQSTITTKHARWLQAVPPLFVAVIAGAWIVFAVNDSESSSAPGVTLDEPFNVQQGVRLVYGIDGWFAGEYSLTDVFGEADDFPKGRRPPLAYHLPDHPPLGRLWLGMWHEIASSVSEENDEQPVKRFSQARVGSAIAFTLTVFLVGFVTARWYGTFAGFAASLSLATMPRLFGHAHFAALETVTNLTFAASLLSVAALWTEKPPRLRVAAFTGFLFGLVLLTKIQAVFLPLPIAIWALSRYRMRAVLPLLVWGGVGFTVFFAGWPWLWLDPLHHPVDYFRQTTERASLHAFYCGTRYLDRDIPWHYSFVMFLLSVPVGWQLAGVVGFLKRKENRDERWRISLPAGTILLPLVVFAIPGVTVYDGVRLFLVVFPLWAVFIGRGTAALFEVLRRRSSRFAVPIFAVLLATAVIPLWQFRPCYLSYYNAAAGGLWGAEKEGMEVSYWGDGLTTEFLNEAASYVPEGATIDVVPLMHQFQLPTLREQAPVWKERNITLRGYDPKRNGPPKYVLYYRRRADLPAELEPLPDNARILAAVRRQGVVVAALIEWRDDKQLIARKRKPE